MSPPIRPEHRPLPACPWCRRPAGAGHVGRGMVTSPYAPENTPWAVDCEGWREHTCSDGVTGNHETREAAEAEWLALVARTMAAKRAQPGQQDIEGIATT